MGLIHEDDEYGEENNIAIKTAWKQKCKFEDNFLMSKSSKIFHTIKAIICVLLDRKKSLYANIHIDNVMVSSWGTHNINTLDYSGHEWTQLNVGYGIFKNWCYDIFEDSSI